MYKQIISPIQNMYMHIEKQFFVHIEPKLWLMRTHTWPHAQWGALRASHWVFWLAMSSLQPDHFRLFQIEANI